MRKVSTQAKRDFVRGYIHCELVSRNDRWPTEAEMSGYQKAEYDSILRMANSGEIPDGILIEGEEALTIWHWLRYLAEGDKIEASNQQRAASSSTR